MHDITPLTLDSICEGQVPSIFERELREVLDNIADVNTDAEKTRSITITFNIKPLGDRSGAVMSFNCKSKLIPVKVAASTCFLSRHTGRLEAYGTDTRQGILFGQSQEEQPATSDNKVINLKS
jgi:hypothetical protein